jgi:hypothetical protein
MFTYVTKRERDGGKTWLKNTSYNVTWAWQTCTEQVSTSIQIKDQLFIYMY